MNKYKELSISDISGFPPKGICLVTRPTNRKWWQFWKPKTVKEYLKFKIT